jgi:hypothetical protein
MGDEKDNKKGDEKDNKKKVIKVKLNKDAVKQIVGAFAGRINKMLNEDVNESVEVGTKKVGNTKVDYGIRMKFLDDKKEKKKEIDKHYVKKHKKKRRID